MKRIVFWMVALLLMSGVAMAQGNRQGGRQQMDPKTRAERMTAVSYTHLDGDFGYRSLPSD